MVETIIPFSVKSLLSWGNIPLNAFQVKLNETSYAFINVYSQSV